MLKFETTPRGCLRGTFADEHGSRCSIQETNAFTGVGLTTGIDDRLWLGVEIDSVGAGSCRMHLTRGQVAELLPHLASFVLTGRMPADGKLTSFRPIEGGETLVAAEVFAKLLDEYQRWLDAAEDPNVDALAGEINAAIRIGAIGGVSNVIAAIALGKRQTKPLIAVAGEEGSAR